MTEIKKIIALIVTVVLVAAMALSFSAVTSAADEAAFEKELSAFPESYHPYLRQLHGKYPNWSFRAFRTGLDWETVIDNEHDDYALVYNPDSARIFKSLDPDDYDAENDRFYYKDGAFVAGSRIAVEYFMDPRNFLDVGGIFQFELLSFSPLYTVEMVEAVLEDSFMADKKMTWVNKSGKKNTSTYTYAETIYKAGKIYNINPCFIASKILNEVGSRGSESVSGTNDNYPGIYNFYNIGATDGAGAVERGLLWASGGTGEKTTYSRPWTTPYKAIMGGAEFLAEEYIAAGQFTGYLQRFNVNPDSDYKLYTHQYMSNLTGALSQGYSTYRSYKEMGMLDEKLIFSIPVFENMSNAEGGGKLAGAESTIQYGTINRDYRYLRKGPSVDHDTVTDSKGNEIIAEKDAEVRILEKIDTDAYYYEEILTYPYWYKISFKSGSKTYKGYVPASRVDVKTTVHVAKGEADIAIAKSKSVRNQIVSSDSTVAKVIDSNTVKFLKNGYVKLYIYDSYGLFEEIMFKVGNYKSYYPTDMKVTVSGNKATVSSSKHEKATGYGYTLCDMSGNIIAPEFSTKTSRTFSNLKAGSVYDIFANNQFSKYIFTKAVQKPAVVKPETVQNFTFFKDSACNNHLSWDSVSDATGYQIWQYNEKTKSYDTKVVTVPFGTNSYTLSKAQSEKSDKYAVRAYSKYDGVVVYGSWSAKISLASKAPTPSAVHMTDKSSSGFTVNWTGNELCDGYEVYVATPEKPEPYYYKTVTDTSLKVSGFKKLTFRKYKVRSFIETANGKVYSDFSPLAATLTLPQTVKNLNLSAGSSSVTAKWDAVADAAYYNLFYKAGNGQYKSVKVEGTSYKISKLQSLTDYTFYVTATATAESFESESLPSAEVTARTLPTVPKNFRVTYQGFNHIDLSWDKSEGLDSYMVICTDADGKNPVTNETEEGFISIKGLSPLKKYKFRISGSKTENGKKLSSELSAEITSETVIPVVKNYRVSDIAAKSFRLTWDKLEGATGYTLYYKKNGKYQKLLTSKVNSCTVTAVPASSKGYFYLTASFKVGDKTVESEKTKTFTAAVKPATVTGITVTAGVDSATIKWNKVKNVNGYRVYVVKDGKYIYKKTVKGTSCTVSGLDECSYETISVRGYINTSVGTAYGKQAKKSFYTKPSNITKMSQANKTDTSYTLKWSKPSENVNRYYLYRYNDKLKKYERIAVTEKTSYTVKGLKPGTSQRYTVMAAMVKNGKVVSKSERVCNFTCSTYMPKTQNLRLAKATTSSLTLAWDKVEGATAYRVYYYNTAAKAFKGYKQLEDTSITIEGLPSGKEYTFRVNAVKVTKNETYTGYYSSNLKAATK